MAGEPQARGPINDKGMYPLHIVSGAVGIPAERPKQALLIPFFVVVNVAMFITTMYINNCPHNTGGDRCFAKFLRRFSFQPLSENPLLGPSSHTLQKLGALNVNKVVHSHQGWRLVTCIWLHAGVIHILINMLSLLFIGIKLEQEFGLIRIGILYVLSGFGGSLLSALFLRNGISVGASGALFGLLGAMLSELLTNWTIYSNKCAALMTLALVVALNLAVGILPNVDNFAHIGGFFSGFLLGFVLLIKPQFGWVRQRYLSYNIDAGSLRTRQKHQLYQYIFFGISLIVVIVGFVIATIMVFRGVDGNKKCSWCHYLNCVPTSRWKCSTGSAYCTTSQLVNNNQVQLTCLSNNKTTTIAADQSQSILESLCGKLCS